MTKHERLAWMGGFFDGEGCCFLSVINGSPVFIQAGIEVVNTCREALEPFALQWPDMPPIRCEPRSRRTRERDAFRWRATGHDAARVLKSLRPYLRTRYHHADLLVAYQALPWRTMKKAGKRVLRTPEQKFIDLDFALRMAEANATLNSSVEVRVKRILKLQAALRPR